MSLTRGQDCPIKDLKDPMLILCLGGYHVIRKEAGLLNRTSFSVHLWWEFKELTGPTGSIAPIAPIASWAPAAVCSTRCWKARASSRGSAPWPSSPASSRRSLSPPGPCLHRAKETPLRRCLEVVTCLVRSLSHSPSPFDLFPLRFQASARPSPACITAN